MAQDVFWGRVFRRMPAFRGKMRLASIVSKTFLNPEKERVVRLANGLTMKLPNLIENLAQELFVQGSYEKELVDYLVNHLPVDGVFLDVGANIGAISVFLAYQRPDVTVYAFEASANIIRYLKENISINKLDNIRFVHNAVYSEDGLDLYFYSPSGKFGKGSLAPVFTDDKEHVKTVRLDTFCQEKAISPAYIKIDVEGFEYFVIDGMGDYINGSHVMPVIIFEFVAWAEQASSAAFVGAAQTRLIEAGYKLYDFDEYRKGVANPLKDLITAGSRELIAVHE